ncbi:carbohydrate ABC transporter permease [Alicyclobacillus fodiniaquatilis]|jgi:multiple sugar transport system permease protein|uniref:Carbohydrate ABC transporter permease n=1 Tax=Alicyclobacillus fodiniaquatilis TaxID=1661150 RepID=A0ABW4JGT0_9BACL
MGVSSLPLEQKPKAKKSVQRRRETVTFYLLISPWIVGVLAFILGPMVRSLYLSFTNDDLLSPPRWVGLLNYKTMLHDPLFWQSLKVTFVYSIIAVPAGLVASLAIALLLNNAVVGMRWFRTIFYLPSILPGIAVMILWVYIFNPNLGLLNSILSDFGIHGPQWIFSSRWALPSLIIMSLWTAGGNMLIWLAGLKGVPEYLYEAASLDGAGTWAKFRHVTIPMITPTIFFNLIMGLIGALQTFSQGYVMTNGGPLNSTLFFNLFLFNNAFDNFRMGYASALAWVLFIIIMVFSLIVIRSSSAWVYYEGERR